MSDSSGSAAQNWVVGGGLILGDAGLLMVRNRRRDGSHDWSPPGGVIEPGESLVDGLTREVSEETGVEVLDWDGPAYQVDVTAPEMGWTAHIEVHVARSFHGEVRVDDPDGIVVDAAWVAPERCEQQMAGCRRWVSEPLLAWLGGAPRSFRYHLVGRDPATAKLTLL
jgi:8-oxo-dGTP diphosphatase